MAKKTRKSTKSLLMDGALYGAGVAAGGYLVPKVLEMADPSGKLDSKIVNVLTAAAGLFGAGFVSKNINPEVGKVTLGIGIGGVAALISDVAGMGYVNSPSYDLNRIIGGASDNYYGTTAQNPGDI